MNIKKEDNTHKITLIGGYTDKEGATHRDINFGKRLKVKNLIDLDQNPQARIPAQREMMLVASSITAFGKLKMPISLMTIFELDSIDIDDLQAGHDEFLQITRQSKKGEVVSETQTRLSFGVERDGVNYNLVTFGRRLSFKDRVEAQRKGLFGVANMLSETVAQIEKITNEETGLELIAPFETELFCNLDLEDFDTLFAGGELWRQSFRRSGEAAPGERNEAESVNADDASRNEQAGS
jgi:phage FluMu protein gp41